MTRKTIREWEDLPVGDDDTEKRDARRLQRVAERAARRLGFDTNAVLARTPNGLKAGQVVGVLVTPGSTLEILPKIDGNDGAVRAALVRMLAVTLKLRVATGEITALETQRHDLLELLIRLFAVRLAAAVRRGLPRHYRQRAEDLKLMRGRLNVTRQLTRLAIRSDLLACRFDELSVDTPLNRVLKAAVAMLAGITRSAATARLLAELAARLEFVGDTPDPLREPVRLDRTNTAYHELHRLARLFLARDWQSTAGGAAPGFALVFAMNDLFEEYIGRSVRRAVAPWQGLPPALEALRDRNTGRAVVPAQAGHRGRDTGRPDGARHQVEATGSLRHNAEHRFARHLSDAGLRACLRRRTARSGVSVAPGSRRWARNCASLEDLRNPTHPGRCDRRHRLPRRSRRVAATDRRRHAVGSSSSRSAVGRTAAVPLS